MGSLLALAVVAEPSAGQSLTDADRRAAVRAIDSTIETMYVFPAMRPTIVAQLTRAEQAHRYEVADPDVFAQRVTEDLLAASHDGHLNLRSDPDQYAAARAPARSTHGLAAFGRAEAIRDHYGLTGMEILPGNVRYLKISGFEWVPGSGAARVAAAYDDAMRFLADGDAIIIDLRGNGGGYSEAADAFGRGFRTLAGKPRYVLVDGHVASAAEAVAYGLQQERAATIVGSTTYGAANNNKKIPIAPRFILSVSYHRPINPISHTNWENVGVEPDIAVPGSQALDTALAAALDRLAGTPDLAPDRRAAYRWARQGVTARMHPARVPAATLETFAGTYTTIELRATDGELRMYRVDRPRWQQGLLLIPLTDDGLFAVEGSDDVLRVRLTRPTLELLHGSEDAREVFPRDTACQAGGAQAC
jgi:Peptidase family S41